MAKEKILIGVDIEKAGAMFQHPVISVGFVIGTLHGVILERKKFNLQVEWFQTAENGSVLSYGDFEPRCVDEFWSKHPEAIEKCVKNPAPEAQSIAWMNIASWINSLELKYPHDRYNIVFVTDNASFDIANIDYNLEKYLNRLPMRYTTTGKYRSIVAGDDMLEMLPQDRQAGAVREINALSVHDHNCINDAYHIMLQYVMAIKYRN